MFVLFEELFRVDCRHAAGTRGGDCLPIAVVLHVAGDKHAGNGSQAAMLGGGESHKPCWRSVKESWLLPWRNPRRRLQRWVCRERNSRRRSRRWKHRGRLTLFRPLTPVDERRLRPKRSTLPFRKYVFQQ